MILAVRLYYGTSATIAEQILGHGFRDGPPQWGAQLAGVWLATFPLDQNEGVQVPESRAESRPLDLQGKCHIGRVSGKPSRPLLS
jgi:hypothetical protein